MNRHISEDRYLEEVEQQAKYIVDEVDSKEVPHFQRNQIEEQYHDSLHGHGWFSQRQELSFYAEIIEHAVIDPEAQLDTSTLLDHDSVKDALEFVAYRAFSDDVRLAALGMVEVDA